MKKNNATAKKYCTKDGTVTEWRITFDHEIDIIDNPNFYIPYEVVELRCGQRKRVRVGE